MMPLQKQFTFMFFAMLAVSCSCQYGIGITGREDATDDVEHDPTFDLPIENLGDPGWRDSTEPWCYGGEMDRNGYDLWSDSRGVFVVLELYASDGGPMREEHTIYFNDGSGWSTYLTEPSMSMEVCVTSLTGLPGGALLGWDTNMATCKLTTFVGGVGRSEGFSVYDVCVVNEELAYAVPVGDPRIVKFEGGSWGPLPGDPVPYEVNHLWANEEIIFASGPSGVMLSNEAGEWTVHDTRTMSDFQSSG